ncbi:MAG TPA: hypothetical protein VM536_06910 [Chloroflexia bacterium]|nr:hypothetical protein [Chloroflexia bacterium]
MLDYSWLLQLVPLAAFLLLPASGLILVKQRSRLTRGVVAAFALALAVELIYSNGLVSAPGWLAAGAFFFLPCAVIGAALGHSATLLRQSRRWHASLTLALVAWWVWSAGGLSGIVSDYTGWGFAALLPFIGGFALASSIATRQRQRIGYTSLWLLFAGTIGIGAYMNHMESITYAFVAPERMFGAYAPVRVAEAVLASGAATLIYVAGSLLLLVLPFISGASWGIGSPQAGSPSDSPRLERTKLRDQLELKLRPYVEL